MLTFLDRHEMHLENKGGNLKFNSHNIIITTNIDPRDWYPHVLVETKAPLARRIKEFAQIWDFQEMTPGPFSIDNINRTLRKDFNADFAFREVANTNQNALVQRNRSLSMNANWDFSSAGIVTGKQS